MIDKNCYRYKQQAENECKPLIENFFVLTIYFSGLHFVKYNAKKHDFILLTCLQNALQITSMFSTSSRMEKFWHNRLKPLKLFIEAKKMIFAVYGLTFDLEISTLSFVFINYNDIEKRKFLIHSWLERSLKSQFCINKNVLRLIWNL